MTAPPFAGLGNPFGRAIGGHHSANSGTDEWLTPPTEVLNPLGGWEANDLDPCSPINRPWPTARQHYTEMDNGLLLPWHGEVWLNPPYSRPQINRFMGRMVEHGRGIALLFARTETDLFFRYVWEAATACLFMRGRINFHHVDGRQAKANSGAPTVLVGYGPAATDRLAACGIPGQFVPLRLPRGVVVIGLGGTWPEVVAAALKAREGPVALSDLYRAIARHPKARGRIHYQAKIRQVLQNGVGRRVAPGVWEASA